MKVFKFLLMMPILSLAFSCGGDDKITNDNNPEGQGENTQKIEERTVELSSSSLTDKGYYDGLLYYKITSNNPMEATVSSCEKNAINVLVPTWLKIDGDTYKVKDISDQAFLWCTDLKSIVIPNSVTTIGGLVFCGCTSLTSIVIPNSVTSIGDGAFYDCVGLTSIVIPNGVKYIGEGTFAGCAGLTSIEIPNGVTHIGDGAFGGCTSLTSMVIPKSVTNIDGSVFGGCSSLASIIVDEGNVIYDSRNNCNAIIETANNTLISGCKNAVIPCGITSIGESAFVGCTGLVSIMIPNSVTHIGDASFEGCTGLTSIMIPNSVTYIGGSTFSRCKSLTSIVIPNGVTSIGGYSFSDCNSLTSIVIPNSVTNIGENAFYKCISLTSVHIKCSNPPLTDLLSFPSGIQTLYVPIGTKSQYANIFPWNTFQNIVEE